MKINVEEALRIAKEDSLPVPGIARSPLSGLANGPASATVSGLSLSAENGSSFPKKSVLPAWELMVPTPAGTSKPPGMKPWNITRTDLNTSLG